MKYIRMKDGRIFYARKKRYNAKDGLNWESKPKGLKSFFTLNYKDDEIIKVADTIEELCDCYSYDTETTRDIAVARSWKLHGKEREIFGCIKTNKGLVYVAKMKGILPNGEIDWELL